MGDLKYLLETRCAFLESWTTFVVTLALLLLLPINDHTDKDFNYYEK